MNLRSIISRATFLGLLLSIISCNKQAVDAFEPVVSELTIKSAHDWFDQYSLYASRARQKGSRFGNLVPLWNKAYEGKSTLGEKFIEVPLKSSKYVEWTYYDKTTRSNQTNLSLVIFIQNNIIKENVKGILPDLAYAKLNHGVISSYNYSGRVITWNWDGSLIGGSFYKDGKREGTIKPVAYSKNGRRSEIICDTYYTCYWSSYCNEGGSFGQPECYGTTTTSVNDDCPYPDYGHGASDDYYCSAWEPSGSDSYQQCREFGGDPSPGEGSGPGGSGSGGVLSAITRSSSLDDETSKKLEDILKKYIENCLYKAVYDYFVSHDIKFNFRIDPNSSSPAYFSYSDGSIAFQSSNTIELGTLGEELFHAYQNGFYGGLGQYNNTGRSNIEFEAKLGADIVRIINGEGCCMTVNPNDQINNEYYLWITEMTNNGTQFPSSYSQMESKYFYFLEQFKNTFPAYNYPTDPNRLPDALLSGVGQSNCKK